MIAIRLTRQIVLVLLALPLLCAAQAPPAGEIEKKVDAVFEAYDKPDSPGCALGVIRDGKLIYARGYGMANLEHNLPITPKTIFDIGSTSKQFTAASIMLLAQQGKLALDDDVRKFIPELPVYPRPVTVGHLLHHTSGIRDYLSLWGLAGVNFEGITTEADALHLIVRQKVLNFPPGNEYLYSNSGFFLLSVIVRRAAGQSLRQFAQQNIFDALGMKGTHFHDDHTLIVPQRATGYAPVRSGGFRIAMSGFEQTGDGAVYTSVEEMLLWDRNFYDPKVGGPEMIRQMTTPGALASGSKITYALGLVVDQYKGLPTVSHGGSWAGYRAELLRFPGEKFSVVCLCNLATANPSRLARQVADVYLADKLQAAPQTTASAGPSKPEPVTLPEAKLKNKPGLYRGTSSSALLRITLRDGRLWFALLGAPPEELQAFAGGKFRVAAWPSSYELSFEPAPPGTVRVRFVRENAREEAFEPVEAFPEGASLAEFAGSYYSEELDVILVVAQDGDRLAASVKDQRPRPLTRAFRDGFTAPGGAQYEFVRDAQGRITGFLVHAGRIRNVRFAKRE